MNKFEAQMQTLQEKLDEACELGKVAFEKGLCSNPRLNKKLRKMIGARRNINQAFRLSDAWRHGYFTAQLKENK